MHMGRFGSGLAEAAARNGALIHEHTPVQRLERRHGSSYRVHTPQGSVELSLNGAVKRGGLGRMLAAIVYSCTILSNLLDISLSSGNFRSR